MDKYQTIQILGEGSFGTVYLIADQKGKKYALKKVQVDPFKVEDALKQIDVMRKIKHPNLIHIHSYEHDGEEKLQILMEYCEEGDLLRYLKKHKKSIPIQEIMNIFEQIVKAFIAMNVKGIIHRDLKPENVLLSKNKVVKIADFGCAREGEFSKVSPGSFDKGTPIYSSPQQLTNEPYSSKCDVWSAGCLLYFIYFGSHPFIDISVQKSLIKIKKLTEKKEIKLDKEADPIIKKIISLSLIYSDRNRATWRELFLSRLFSKRITNIENYLVYLWSISNIANWITGEFWKSRKEMNIQKTKNQLFAYFMIKFQYTNILLAVQIIKKSPQYQYLFNSNAYEKLDPQKLAISRELMTEISKRQEYYKSIKNHMADKEVYAIIQQRQPDRTSCFSDLDNSIRAGYKILQDVLPQMKGKKSESLPKGMELVWVTISKWINFTNWFSFEKKPRIEDFMNEVIVNPSSVIEHELDKYTHGILS